MPEIAGLAARTTHRMERCPGGTWASLDSVPLVFDGASMKWRNLTGGIVALHRAIRPA